MSEIKHQYGKNIHILSDPYLQTLLAQLCSEETIQPTVSHLITSIYSSLIQTVANDQFPTRPANRATRMAKFHPKESVIIEPIIDPETSVISVNLARAGTSTLREFAKIIFQLPE
jgi:uracil phosphoribosyltransferase